MLNGHMLASHDTRSFGTLQTALLCVRGTCCKPARDRGTRCTLQYPQTLYPETLYPCAPARAVLAYVVAACAPTMDIANAALPMFVITQMFFTGFLIREADMPVYWRYWAPYADFIRHAWHAQMANQFGGRPDVLFAGVEPVLQYYAIRCAVLIAAGACTMQQRMWLRWLSLVCTVCHMLLRHVEYPGMPSSQPSAAGGYLNFLLASREAAWASLGYASLFFLGFFCFAWLVRSCTWRLPAHAFLRHAPCPQSTQALLHHQ